MKPMPITDASTWTQRYEAVREHLLTGRQTLGADPLGLVLLLEHGVAGWMSWWLDGLAKDRSSIETPAVLFCPPTPIWQQQLTMLLAQMTATQLWLFVYLSGRI